jgi:uncharacterized protein YndB with AHSA1/START domain
MHMMQGATGDFGDLEQSGESWRLRFVRDFDQSVKRLWSALTDPEEMTRWFPMRIVGMIEPGAKLRFEHPAVPTFDGEVLAYEPPRVLEFRWGPDVLRFEIQQTPNGCTLIFTDTFGEYGKAARDAAGWHECLDSLNDFVSGTTSEWSVGQRWAEVHPSYVEKLGPGASTVGPPQGIHDNAD